MSKDYEDSVIREFEGFDSSRFSVNYRPYKIFICGGGVNGGVVPASMRERVLAYLSGKHADIHDSMIMAESFNDYLQGAYADLLEFESCIGSIASLIVVCLESPGALVELGMFCSNPLHSNKLFVIAPQDKLEGRDSFIWLGPLRSISERNADSVAIYPWPSDKVMRYDDIDLVVSDLLRAISGCQKTEKFKRDNPAHVAFLVHDVVLLAYPIKLHEIQLALMAAGIDCRESEVSQALYLLEKICLVQRFDYGGAAYFYTLTENRRIKFGVDVRGVKKDAADIRMVIRQSYVLSGDDVSKKRVLALRHILKRKEGGS